VACGSSGAGAGKTPPPPQIVRLTTLAGTEDWPAFSPDGQQVAFAWDGDKRDNVDIYVTLVGSTNVRRLTMDPQTTTRRAGRLMACTSRFSDRPGMSPTFTSCRHWVGLIDR